MTGQDLLVNLGGVAELPLPRRGARPRFLTAVVLALLAAADDEGVVMDARRAIGAWLDGSDRYPDRKDARRIRQQLVVGELQRMKKSITRRATRNGHIDPLLYMMLGGTDVDRRLYSESLSPVLANVSRCLSILAKNGLVERWYWHPESDETSERCFRGAVVCVRLTGPLRDLWQRRAA